MTEHVEVGRGDVSIIQASSPRDRYTDSEWREREEDKSLEGLLTLARREMEQEKQLRKVNTQSRYDPLKLNNFFVPTNDILIIFCSTIIQCSSLEKLPKI